LAVQDPFAAVGDGVVGEFDAVAGPAGLGRRGVVTRSVVRVDGGHDRWLHVQIEP